MNEIGNEDVEDGEHDGRKKTTDGERKDKENMLLSSRHSMIDYVN
jgi:hypothetical protein